MGSMTETAAISDKGQADVTKDATGTAAALLKETVWTVRQVRMHTVTSLARRHME